MSKSIQVQINFALRCVLGLSLEDKGSNHVDVSAVSKLE
jgi:hypothetical protein